MKTTEVTPKRTLIGIITIMKIILQVLDCLSQYDLFLGSFITLLDTPNSKMKGIQNKNHFRIRAIIPNIIMNTFLHPVLLTEHPRK